MASDTPARYAVIGNPIAHSQSPFIHTLFAKQTGIVLSYEKYCPPITEFANTVRIFINDGGQGMNVTLPFKQEAFALAHSLTPRGHLAGAVNTLKFISHQIIGENTDGIGLISDLEKNLAYDLQDKKIVLLGAGGAARGVLLPLLEKKPHALFIANRTASRAQLLAAEFAAFANGIDLRGGSLLDTPSGYDLLINASTSSLNNHLPDLPAYAWTFQFIYDMAYGPHPLPLLQFANDKKIRNTDGVGMLVEQAAHSFAFWHNVFPDTAPVLAVVRKMLTMN